MITETPQADQPASVESQHATFLGTRQNDIIAELEANQNPEPEAEETAETPEAEPAEAPETQDQPEGEEEPEQQAASEEETTDDWLPNEQEKEFPRETIDAFAQKRYPKLWAILEKDPDNEAIRQILKDKLNTDILVRQMRESATEEEPTLEEEAEEQPAETTAQPDLAQQQQQYQQYLTNLVDTSVNPQAVEQFGAAILNAFGIDEAKLKDPNVPKEEKETIKALYANRTTLGRSLAMAATDLLATVGPKMFAQWAEQAYPGTGAQWETQQYAQAWEAVRHEKGKDGKPLYAGLPDFYGDGQLAQLITNAEKELGLPQGGLEKMTMPGAKDIRSQAVAKYRLVAKISAGKKATPAEVAAAVDTGKKLATDAGRRRSLGKVLGAGKPSQQIDTSPEKDDMDTALDAEFEEQRSKSNPFAAVARK